MDIEHSPPCILSTKLYSKLCAGLCGRQDVHAMNKKNSILPSENPLSSQKDRHLTNTKQENKDNFNCTCVKSYKWKQLWKSSYEKETGEGAGPWFGPRSGQSLPGWCLPWDGKDAWRWGRWGSGRSPEGSSMCQHRQLRQWVTVAGR